jgi:hypothetical protein
MFLHWQARHGAIERPTYYSVTTAGTIALVAGQFNLALDLSQGGVTYDTSVSVGSPGTFLGIENGTLYTLECWVYGTTTGTILTLGTATYNINTVGTDWHTIKLNIASSAVKATFKYYSNGTFFQQDADALSQSLTAAQWNHICLTKTSNSAEGTWLLRVNGATGSTYSADFGAVNSGAYQVLDLRDFTIGSTSSFAGPYIDEVRLSSTTRYGTSGTYVVPTSEFAQDVNTKLLTHLDSLLLPAYYSTV